MFYVMLYVVYVIYMSYNYVTNVIMFTASEIMTDLFLEDFVVQKIFESSHVVGFNCHLKAQNKHWRLKKDDQN